MNDDLAREILARLERIESLLQHRESLSQEDKAKIDALLPFLNGDAFTAKSLRDDSVRRDNLELARVLDAIGNQHNLGQLLRRCAEAKYGVACISTKRPTLWQRI